MYEYLFLYNIFFGGKIVLIVLIFMENITEYRIQKRLALDNWTA